MPWIGTVGIFTAGVGLIAVLAAVAAMLRTFPASREERQGAMAADFIVRDPMYTTTQAVTIEASPEGVWPWVAQMGAGRAGWYSYDRIDNGGHRSATTIVPEYQRIAVGDVMPAIRGATDAFIVAAVQPPRDLVLTVPAASGGSIVSWEFFLQPLDPASTRLIVRGRVSPHWLQDSRSPLPARPIFIERVYGLLAHLPRPLLLAVGGLGHRMMQNRQLRGIKDRAEGAERRLAIATVQVP